MIIADCIEESIVDGPGIRFVVFCQGCILNCKGCHNKEIQSLEGGRQLREEEVFESFKQNSLLDGLTISGGEPLLQAKELADFLKKFKLHFKDRNVVIYTGYTFEEILKASYENYLKDGDILVDGPFVLKEQDYNLKFKGSKNQRILDLKKSIKSKRPILYKF